MNDIGIVVIGRNEGQRLRRCLASLTMPGAAVVYVDSDSSDGSPELARSMGAEVVTLDMSLPFCAARARNEGVERLLRNRPGVQWIQFVDGDCEIVAGWMQRARSELQSGPDIAVICGRRRERHPEASVYNKLADLEWDTPTGIAKSCGGDSMMRTAAFLAAGGFDPSIAAGEEPELCQRLRQKGWKITRIDAEMTLHDSAMLSFGQWWKRTIRSGYGSIDVATRFGDQGLFVRQVRAAKWWAGTWPMVAVLAAMVSSALTAWPWLERGQGRSVAALAIAWVLTAGWLAMLPMQVLRVAIKGRRRLENYRTALAYGALTMIGKWANRIGQRQYLRDRASGRNTRLIDYKSGEISSATMAPM